MKKKILLTGLLSLALMTPAAPAKAQGWPTFDVAKLASLISNLIGRFQPVPQVLSRVSQVKSTMEQVKAAGKAAMAGGLKEIGKQAASGLKKNAFSGGKKASPIDTAHDASASSEQAKSYLFALGKKELTQAEKNKIRENRAEYKKKVQDEVLSTAFYMAMNGPAQSAERFEKATEVMTNAGTVQDAINANTMMIMAGNYERMNRLVIDLALLKRDSLGKLEAVPVGGYHFPKKAGTKDQAANDPEHYYYIELGDEEYVEQEKDEADVDL